MAELEDLSSDSSSDAPIDQMKRKAVTGQTFPTRKKVKRGNTARISEFFQSSSKKFDYKVIKPDPDDHFAIIGIPHHPGSAKIAAFDMDYTLVQPKSGNKFAKGRGDWMWWPNGSGIVKRKLQALHKKGYRIVIVTNQAGIEKGRASMKEITGKIMDISHAAGIPMVGLVCGGKNKWRKPYTTQLEYFATHMNEGIRLDPKLSFYCGDAAGRPKGWMKGKKKDFSCSDRNYAENLAFPFHTPEAFFLNHKEYKGPIQRKAPNPKEFLKNVGKKSDLPSPMNRKEMIVMVGPPGSGKSRIACGLLKDYARVNQDTLKSASKCKKVCKEYLKAGKPVVIDNTCPGLKKRKEWIKLAEEYNYPVRCFWMNFGSLQKTVEIGKHLNSYRTRQTNRRPVPMVAFHSYAKIYAQPTTSEGFESVHPIPFIPEFRCTKDEVIFKSWMPHLR